MSLKTVKIYEYDLETEEGHWVIDITVKCWASPGTPPWKGSVYSCPSDVDWYGEDPSVDGIEEIRVASVAWDVIDREDIELAPWEQRVIAEHIEECLDENRVFEALEPDEPWFV